MSDPQILLAGQASIWAQPDGPNTKPLYLGCHQMGDIELPGGDLTRLYCPDPSATGKYKVSGSFQGEPGVPTFSIDTPIGKTRDYLERWLCQGNILVNKLTTGRRDLFANFDRAFAFTKAARTGRTMSNLASRQPGDEGESMQSMTFSFEDLIEYFDLTSARQTIAALGDVAAVWFVNAAQCASDTAPAVAQGMVGAVVTNSLASPGNATGEVYFTEDGGVTWTVAAADPFAASEDIVAVVGFYISRTTRRYIVARGTTDAGNPAEVAYTDDDGATWTTVDLGSTNALFVTRAQGLFALDPYNIWAVTSGGHIFYSEDGGVSWTEQEDGTLTVQDLNAIQFVSENVGYAAGASNVILKTEDGGTTWTPLTGPSTQAAAAVLSMAVVTKSRVFLGYDNGELWYTEDGGTTWAQRSFYGDGVGDVTGLRFVNEMCGFMTHNNASPVGRVLRTRDGGYTWEAEALPTNAGINDIWPVDENLAFVAGNVQGTTGFVGKVMEA
jgi:photosystem II stability/assembly factor-like uncharacterized protein